MKLFFPVFFFVSDYRSRGILYSIVLCFSHFELLAIRRASDIRNISQYNSVANCRLDLNEDDDVICNIYILFYFKNENVYFIFLFNIIGGHM